MQYAKCKMEQRISVGAIPNPQVCETVLFLFQSKKRYIIGFFESKESTEYSNFRKVAANLKDDCVFMAGFGNVRSAALHITGIVGCCATAG